MSKIKSKGFINYLLEVFDKLSIDEVKEKELKTITDVILVKNDKDDEYNFIDLEMFPNLQEIVLINFKIDIVKKNMLGIIKV